MLTQWLTGRKTSSYLLTCKAYVMERPACAAEMSGVRMANTVAANTTQLLTTSSHTPSHLTRQRQTFKVHSHDTAADHLNQYTQPPYSTDGRLWYSHTQHKLTASVHAQTRNSRLRQIHTQQFLTTAIHAHTRNRQTIKVHSC